jgi:hypothetical protein
LEGIKKIVYTENAKRDVKNAELMARVVKLEQDYRRQEMISFPRKRY